MTRFAPCTVGEVCEAVLEGGPFRIVGTGSRSGWDAHKPAVDLDLSKLTGILDFRPDDLVVTVMAGTKVEDLAAKLDPSGLCLPLDPECGPSIGQFGGTVGGLIGAGLPHALDGLHGGIRDWCLGMQLVLADGRVCSAGSQVAKSVAGYDIHRAMVGSRGGLAVVASATFRLAAKSARKSSSIKFERELDGPCWIHRCLRSTFQDVLVRARTENSLIASDEPSVTIWCKSELQGAEGVAWSVGPGGQRRYGESAIVKKLERNMKAVFDLDGVFCEGWAE